MAPKRKTFEDPDPGNQASQPKVARLDDKDKSKPGKVHQSALS